MTLRIIVRTDNAVQAAHVGGAVDTRYRTFDVDLPEIEAFLRDGGISENSFLIRQVVGVEIVREDACSTAK
ncbi:hypothetical protein [Bradyrhizobium sp. USDA 4350]